MSDSQKWLILVLLAAFGSLLYLLQPILTPFLAGFLLAYLASPIVNRLVSWKVPRIGSVFIVFIAFSLFFLIIIGGLIPGVKSQIVYLNTKMPDFIRWINSQAIPWIEETTNVSLTHIDISMITDFIGNSWQEAGSFVGQVLSRIATSGMSIIGFLGSMALVPIVTFYLMVDWTKISVEIERLLPRHIQPQVTSLVKECDDVLSSFFRGQFLVMISLTILYTLGLKIVGLEIAVIVGLIAGLGSIIPYFGFTLGIVIATIAAIFQYQEFLPIVWVWTVFGVGQIIEGWVLVPYLVGSKVGLHPVVVIFSILAGGQLFGFFGMLIAIPAAAVIVVLLRHVRRKYLASDLYSSEASKQ